MAKRKDGAGSDRCAGGLGDDGADVALRALVALLIDRAGLKRSRQRAEQIAGRHIGKIAIRGRVALLDGDDEEAVAGNRPGGDDQRCRVVALQIGMADRTIMA